jgi:hypothetical protein
MLAASRCLAVAGLVLFAACASQGSGAPMQDVGSSRYSLTAEELSGTPYPSLLEAIQALRGEWLRKRGPMSFNNEGNVVVYLDGNRLGQPGTLRSISTAIVIHVRYLNPPEAQGRFGMNHPYGAILVITKS